MLNQRNAPGRLCAFALIATAFISVTGERIAAHPHDVTTGSPPPALVGSVMIDQAVLGATIRVFDAKGQLVHEMKDATSGFEGRFAIPRDVVARLPAEFRVVASGGSHEGAPFEGKLELDAATSPLAVLGLNPVTTLMSRYRQRHSQVSREAVEQRVRVLLQIPDGLPLGGDLGPYFDGDLLLAQARESGGFDSTMAALVAAMERTPVTARPFPPPLRSASDADPLTGILGKVGSSIAGKLAGIGVGEIMKLIFPGDDIGKKLDEIQDSIDRLAEDVARLGRDLKLEVRIATLGESIARINAQFDSYARVVARLDRGELSDEEARDIEQTIAEIKAIAYEHFDTDIRLLRDVMLGAAVPGQEPLLDIWTDKVIAEGHQEPVLWTSSYYSKQEGSALSQYRKLESLLQHLVAMQTRAAMMLAEFYAIDRRPVRLAELREQYRAYLKDETSLFIDNVERLVLNSRRMFTHEPTGSYAWNPTGLVMHEFATDKLTPAVMPYTWFAQKPGGAADAGLILSRADKLRADLLDRPRQWTLRFLYTKRVVGGRRGEWKVVGNLVKTPSASWILGRFFGLPSSKFYDYVNLVELDPPGFDFPPLKVRLRGESASTADKPLEKRQFDVQVNRYDASYDDPFDVPSLNLVCPWCFDYVQPRVADLHRLHRFVFTELPAVSEAAYLVFPQLHENWSAWRGALPGIDISPPASARLAVPAEPTDVRSFAFMPWNGLVLNLY